VYVDSRNIYAVQIRGNINGIHVKMEVAPGMYHCYAVMPFVKEAMPAYHRMIEYINGG
jgi:hypothetical protein